MQGSDSGRPSSAGEVATAARSGSRSRGRDEAFSLRLYKLLANLPGPGDFAARVFLFSFLGTQLPLVALLVYLLTSVDLSPQILTTIGIVLVIALLGSAATICLLISQAAPAGGQSTRRAERVHESDLPDDEEIGELMANTQHALKKLQGMIHSMHEISIRDELTGLYNRRFFVEQADQLLARAHRYEEPLTLIFIDMDNFKQVNDRFSHTVGDQALRQVAELISNTARGSDLTARLGGDEFVIVFPNTPISRAKLLCERLRMNLQKYDWAPLLAGVVPTVSIGVAEVQKGDSVEMLLDRADANLHRAKDEGRDQVIE